MNISSEKIKKINKLYLKKYRDLDKKFIVEGDHLVNIALDKGYVDTLITTEDNYSFDNKYLVSLKEMAKLSKQVSPSKVIAVCSYLKETKISKHILLIDSLQDPGNLGTIIRSAVAFNFDTIILGNNTVDIYNDKTIRSSEGMIFNVNILKRDLKAEIKDLKKLDYRIIGTDVKEGINLNSLKANDKIAIIIGNEGSGVNPDLLSLCDAKVNIKMNPKCESLNAGVCASIIMYEVNND